MSRLAEVRGEIRLLTHPVRCGNHLHTRAKVVNLSGSDWIGTGQNPVRISYHWHEESGQVVVFDGIRFPLPGGILRAGETADVALAIPLPDGCERLLLTLTVLQEGIRWFETVAGFTPARVALQAPCLPRVRIALTGTPRSGNTWLNRLLASVCGAGSVAVFSPADLPWETLGERCIAQFHWPPEAGLRESLADHGFTPVVLRRHPFDVLLSILQFCRHEPETARWLCGAHGTEEGIRTATPLDPAFLEYAKSDRARVLLGLSHAWMNVPGTLCVRYEDLVASPHEELTSLLGACGCQPGEDSLAMAIAFHSLEQSRAGDANSHFWQGRPGLWRELLPASVAEELASVHEPLLRAGGYSATPDPDLDGETALRRWIALQAPVREHSKPSKSQPLGKTDAHAG